MHCQVSRKLSIAGAVVPCDRCFLFVYVHDCRDHNRPIKEAKVDLFLYRSQKNLGLVSQSGGLFATKMTAVNGGCYFELTAGFDGYLEVRGPGLRPVELLMKDFAWVAVADMRQGEERKIFLTMIDDDAPAPADLDETVTRYLDSVDVVRVRVEYATNLGHQSAALAMIARLRDIGYAGLIQALVSNRDPKEEGEVSVAEKLRKLRPDFPDTGDLDVTWLRDSGSGEFDSPPASGVSALGMIGAIDAKVGAFQSYRINTLKVPAALFLQPFNWHEGQRAICTEQIEKTACLPSTSTYLLDVHACDTAALCRAAGLEGAAGDLLAILESARSAVDLMVAYGLARGRGDPTPQVVLCNLLCGLLAAQEAHKTVVLLVHKNDDLANALIHDRVKWAKTPSGTIAAQIDNLAVGEILVVCAPHLPQDVFQQLCKQSTLPVLLEGANTTNLVHLLGIPYFSVNSANTGYPRYIDVKRLQAMEEAVNAPANTALDDHTDVIRLFLTDCRDGNLRAMFQHIRARATTPSNDQVKMGLYVLAMRLAAEKRGDAEVPGVNQDNYHSPEQIEAKSAAKRAQKPLAKASAIAPRKDSSSDDDDDDGVTADWLD